MVFRGITIVEFNADDVASDQLIIIKSSYTTISAIYISIIRRIFFSIVHAIPSTFTTKILVATRSNDSIKSGAGAV